jgi:hypothetical protein
MAANATTEATRFDAFLRKTAPGDPTLVVMAKDFLSLRSLRPLKARMEAFPATKKE